MEFIKNLRNLTPNTQNELNNATQFLYPQSIRIGNTIPEARYGTNIKLSSFFCWDVNY